MAWWYRQNLFLAVDPVFEPWVRAFPRLSGTRPREPVDYVGGPYDRPENARRAPTNPESP